MAQDVKTPARNSSQDVPLQRGMSEWNPFATLRREIDRMFDDVWRFPYAASPTIAPAMQSFASPAVDVVEKPNEFEITAELPGLNDKDVEVTCADGALTIKGEKKDEKEERQGGYFLSERRFGSFQRSFRLPDSVDPEKIEAEFKNGVLKLTLPKRAEAQRNQKKIAIKAG